MVLDPAITEHLADDNPSSKEKVVQLFGFRKKDGIWQLTATEELQRRK